MLPAPYFILTMYPGDWLDSVFPYGLTEQIVYPSE